MDAIDTQISQLRSARKELAALLRRSQGLDPASCTDLNRCQVISRARSTT